MLRATYYSPETETGVIDFEVSLHGPTSIGELRGVLQSTPGVPLDVRMLAKVGECVFLRRVGGSGILPLSDKLQVSPGEWIIVVEQRPAVAVLVVEAPLTIYYLSVAPGVTYASLMTSVGVSSTAGIDRVGDVDVSPNSLARGSSVIIVRPDHPAVATSTSDLDVPADMQILLQCKYGDREAAFREAFEAHGNSCLSLVVELVMSHGARGKALSLLRRFREATASYITGPEDALCSYFESLTLAQASLLRANPAKEEEIIRDAVSRCKESWTLQYRLGACLVRRGASAEALPLLKRAFQLVLGAGKQGVEVARIRAYMGVAIAVEGDSAKGCANVMAAHQQAPEDLEVVCLLSRAYCAKGDDLDAVKWAVYALGIDPSVGTSSISGLNLVHVALHVPNFVFTLVRLVTVDVYTASLFRLIYDVVRRAGMLELASEIILMLGRLSFDTEMVYLHAGLLEESCRHWQVVSNCYHTLNRQAVIPLGIPAISCMSVDRVVEPLRSLQSTPTLDAIPKVREAEARLRMPRLSMVVVDVDGAVSTSEAIMQPTQLTLRRILPTGTYVAPPLTACVCGSLFTVVRCLFAFGRIDKVVEVCSRMNGLASPDLFLDKTIAREDVIIHRIIIQVVQHIPRYDLHSAIPREPFYIVGDSHVLSSAWQPLTFGGKEWLVIPGFIPHMAINDLGSFTGSRRMFDTQVQGIPFRSTMAICLGDLDCKGSLFTAVEDGICDTIDESALRLAQLLLDTCLSLCKKKHVTLFLHYPPPIVPELVGVTMTLWRALDSVMGAAFSDPSIALHPVRLYGALHRERSIVDPKWTISGTHYSPAYTSLLEQELDGFMPAAN